MQRKLRLKIWSMLLLTIISPSCSLFTDQSAPFISTSGSGQVVINELTPISLKRAAIYIDDTTLELHILGSYCTMSSEGVLQGEGLSLIATLPYDPLFSSLEGSSYTIEGIPSCIYTTQFELTTSTADYTDIDSGTLIIRESQGTFDIQAIGTDSAGNSIITNYTGYLLRTVDLRAFITE